MINPLKNKGFRNMFIKGIVFIAIVVLLQYIIKLFLVDSNLFAEFLDIPEQFQIGKGIISISITNAIIFGLIVFIILTYKKIFLVKDYKIKANQLWFIVLSICFFIAHYVFKFMINRNLEFFMQAPLFWGIIKIVIQLLFAGALFLGIFGLEFTKYLFTTYKKQIIITSIVTIVFFLLMMLVQNLWTYFSTIISEILNNIFRIFFDNVTYKPFVSSFTMTEGGGPLLGINNFRAIVGKPCSGIDSFLLFTSLYALIFILDYKKIKKPLATGLFFLGIIGMFLTNVLRILLLFIVGAYVDAKFAIGLFHTNAGWILFILYFFLYWGIVSKYIYKKDVEK
jgi:exosortase/archaeosortase family protein